LKPFPNCPWRRGRTQYPIGDVIHAAVESGLSVEAEVFEGGHYIDIGTPKNLLKAVQKELLTGARSSP